MTKNNIILGDCRCFKCGVIIAYKVVITVMLWIISCNNIHGLNASILNYI